MEIEQLTGTTTIARSRNTDQEFILSIEFEHRTWYESHGADPLAQVPESEVCNEVFMVDGVAHSYDDMSQWMSKKYLDNKIEEAIQNGIDSRG